MRAGDYDGGRRALREDAHHHRPQIDAVASYNQRRSKEKPRAGRTSAIAAAYSVSEPFSLSNMTVVVFLY